MEQFRFGGTIVCVFFFFRCWRCNDRIHPDADKWSWHFQCIFLRPIHSLTSNLNVARLFFRFDFFSIHSIITGRHTERRGVCAVCVFFFAALKLVHT